MENKYGVGITNRYSCFIDNEDLDPLEQLKLAENEKESKKKGKTSSTATAEKENRGKETTSTGISVQQEKESPPTPPTTVAQKKKPAVIPAAAPAARKGIRDSNAKGNEVRGPYRGGHVEAGGDRRGPRPDRFQGERFPRGGGDRFQGDRDRVQGGERNQGERGARFPNDEGREIRNNRRNQDDSNREQVGEFDPRGPPRQGFAPRGRPGGSNFRGGPGYRGGAGGPRKREFDRQSGSDKSGVKAIDKRDGAGSRNWGTYKDDEIESAAPVEENAEEKVEGQEGAMEGTEDKADTSLDSAEPVEEEPKQMTLEQWKALQQPRNKPVFNLRKAGEGEDQTKWKKMTLKKKEKEEGSGEEEEEEEYDCPQRAGRQRQLLDVNFHFADSRRGGFSGPSRGRGFGGGRGFDRGGRGGGPVDRGDRPPQERGGGPGSAERGGFGADRGAERGGERGFSGYRNFRGGRGGFNREDRSPRQTAPKVDDERDFPSLG